MKNLIFLFTFVLSFNLPSFASEPAIWTTNSKADVLKGEAFHVSIGDDGTIRPSPGFEELASVGQPYVWSTAIDRTGNVYMGTGPDGKVFRVSQNGSSEMIADLDEVNVSAVAIGRNGEVFAATSPDGKVYRLDSSGNASVYFEPGEKYIWSLAVGSDGSLFVGTGENGRIYRVSGANASAAEALVFDSSETHIISLDADSSGNVYAGTDPGGFVLRIGQDRKVFALLDSPLREIHEIAVGVNGSVYALALGESVSTSDSSTETEKPATKTISAPAKKSATPTPPPVQKSKYDLSGAKSVVYRILPSGQADVIWKSESVSAFALYAHQTGNGVMVGTSDKGRIFSVRNSGEESLALQTGEGQVSAIDVSGNRLFASTSSQGKLFRIGGDTDAESRYESPVLGAGGNAAWGRIWWRGEGNVQIQTRSGNTETPDETWSEWSAAYSASTGSTVTSPAAAFLQWRAILVAGAAVPSVSEVHISYLPTNIAPEILSVEVLPANVGLAPNPKPPVDPNIETSGMDPVDFGIIIPPTAPRKLFQMGAKSLTWKAEDRNGDSLVYSVYFKEVGDDEFKLLKSGIEDAFYTVDGLAFADGRYVFRIIASDAPSNPASKALTGELESEPFDIDNSPPSVSVSGSPTVNGNTVTVKFSASESSSYISRAEFSVNGGKWRTVYADDGIPDSRSETFTVTSEIAGTGEFAIALRVFDAVGNSGTARALVSK
ncbi:MAG: hypothetical protein DWQ47_17315 [Acidobacteria bacterium]|nr:MAG: hypothetical protein DWQ32_04715 [Acidobacteriota bacterium]REK02199.1 MAG: hypothetical protein DWQ38_07435 [Acidobacteriota bacterium]REK13998.1 MAG: hypothetical protein DWQ43_10405 [Acidobacteriota bacterium]REK41993.1 MAG: hypothetical protein DWQ47_17315 [Acidobacteriota bacterium]